jgi:CopG family nickel-responsive transcriptional regulator
MAKLARFGVSLDEDLLVSFDRDIRKKKYKNRSEAIRDLIREKFVKKEWDENKDVAGVITLVYDHHKRELVGKLTSIQHDWHKVIVSSHHVHLDHNNCLESVVVKGKASDITELADSLKAIKGVAFAELTAATLAKKY